MEIKTKIAVQGSIQKWQDILAGKIKDHGTDNCPLCVLFVNKEVICRNCPVYKITFRSGCSGTPYINWITHQKLIHDAHLENGLGITCKECEKHAKNEIIFLEDLL